jgi:hypothetical protein
MRSQNDLPHRAAGGAVDAGHQLDPPCPRCGVCVSRRGSCASPATDAGRTSFRKAERLVQGLAAGRQRIGPVAAPMPARTGRAVIPLAQHRGRTMRARNALMRPPISRPNMRHVRQGGSLATLPFPSTRPSVLRNAKARIAVYARAWSARNRQPRQHTGVRSPGPSRRS